MEEAQELTCTVNAKDDLSGIDRVNAHFQSPSGASMASFYFSSKDSDNVVYEEDGSVTMKKTTSIPLGVEPGQYELVLDGAYKLYVEDKVRNYRIYSQDEKARLNQGWQFPDATFEVKSEFDQNGPYVTSLECDKSSILLGKGESEKVNCRVVAQDDISGLDRVLITYYSPSGKDFVTFEFHHGSQTFGRKAGGIFTDEATFSHDQESGAWIADKGITAIDKLGNLRIYDKLWMSKNKLPTFINIDKLTLNDLDDDEGVTSGASITSAILNFATLIMAYNFLFSY